MRGCCADLEEGAPRLTLSWLFEGTPDKETSYGQGGQMGLMG
jgi:hypothetical protein